MAENRISPTATGVISQLGRTHPLRIASGVPLSQIRPVGMALAQLARPSALSQIISPTSLTAQIGRIVDTDRLIRGFAVPDVEAAERLAQQRRIGAWLEEQRRLRESLAHFLEAVRPALQLAEQFQRLATAQERLCALLSGDPDVPDALAGESEG